MKIMISKNNMKIIDINKCDNAINEITKIVNLFENVEINIPFDKMNLYRIDAREQLNDCVMERRLLMNRYLFTTINEIVGIKKITEIFKDLLKNDSIYSCENGMICKTGIKELDNKIKIIDLLNMKNILT